MDRLFAIMLLLPCIWLSAHGSIHIRLNGGKVIVMELPDSIEMTPTKVSIAVTEGVFNDDRAASIGSEILLNSELRGHIENPNYYFENTDSRTDSNLDLLMMTQGWRRYASSDVLNDSMPQIRFPIERTQSISGHVETAFNRSPKGMKLVLFSPISMERSDFLLGDSSRFVLQGLDFENKTPITLEVQTKTGETSKAIIHIDNPEMPDVLSLKDCGDTSEGDESVVVSLAGTVGRQLRAPSLMDDHELGEVSVTARKKGKWSNRGNFEPHRGYQEGDEKISRFPTMESLLRSLTVKIRYVTEGYAVPEPQFGEYVLEGFVTTLVYIDGFRSDQSEVFLLNPANVNSVEYFKAGDPRVASYDMEALRTGLLLVTTKYGDVGKKTPPLSMANISPLGYQPSVEFYSPVYQVGAREGYDQVDRRATLHWDPDMLLDAEGNVHIDVYNSAAVKSLDVTVQGVTPEGKIIDVTEKVLLP